MVTELLRFARAFGCPARADQSDQNGQPKGVKETEMSLVKMPTQRKAPLFDATASNAPVARVKSHDWGGWLDARTAEATVSQHGLLSMVLTITPDMAKWVLENRHPHNRALRPKTVERYAKDMAAGKWKLSAEAVKFSKSGALIDGQHRLTACIESGCPLTALVIFGVQDDAFDVLDTGKVREAADVLSIDGIDHGKDLAAATRIIIAMEAGGALYPQRMYGTTNADVLRFVRENPEIANSLAIGSKVYASLPRARRNAATAMHFLLARKDKEAADAFFLALASGEGLRRGDPVYALRDRFIRMREERGADKRQRSLSWVVESYIRAWNAFRGNRRLQKVQCDGTIPEIR